MNNHIKRLTGIVLMTVLFSVAPGRHAAAGPAATSGDAWARAADRIQAQKRQALQDASRTEKIIGQERQRLQEELRRLTAASAQLERDFSARKLQFDQLLEKEQALTRELEAQQEEIKLIQGTVKSAARELHSLLADGFMLPEVPEARDTLAALSDSDRFPGMAGIRALIDALMHTIRLSGTRSVRTGSIVGPDGHEDSADILRMGMLTACYRTRNGSVGYLRSTPGGNLIAATADFPRRVRTRIDRYMDGASEHLPLDLSRGAVFQSVAGQTGIVDRLKSGGMLVWPILLVGMLGLGLAIERIVFLGRIRSNTDSIMETVLRMGAARNWPECRSFCQEHLQVPVCRVMLSALQHLGTTRDVIEDALQEALLKEIPRLERFVPTLSVLAAIAPLLGLLGTVTGMINTFHVITIFGTGDPRMMSGGISEALVTTQLGLAVAIPIMFLHHFLERRVDAIVGDMEGKGTAFAVTLVTANAVERIPV